MKTSFTFFFFSFFLIFNCVSLSQSIEYTSPKDHSVLVSLNSNIILKSSEFIDPASLSPDEFSVIGSASGIHQGTVKLSDDNKTILFLPATAFSANENVIVNVYQSIKTIGGVDLPAVTIHFKTTPLSHRIDLSAYPQQNNEWGNIAGNSSANKFLNKSLAADTLPSDFPQITVDTLNNPSDGKIFLANISPTFNAGNYLMILNNDGSVLKYKPTDGLFGISFTVLPNGELSYAEVTSVGSGVPIGSFIVMDTTLAPVDTFQCGNGYYANPSDFILLPNGHAILFATDPEPVDMSQYGGSSNAIVDGAVIQELDESKNVVFQWRSWDYLPISDSYIDLTTNIVDLIHGNALAVDANGSILFSMRHLSSIISIDRQTGDINWILGGKQNQFTFINENSSNSPNFFSFQHDIRVLPNGDITLFDNGTQHVPQYSRGVEYKLDEQNKTATMVWEYRHSPDIFTSANGSVQRLENGNTIIGWGQASAAGAPMFTEVHPDNTLALEFTMPMGHKSFRALKFSWPSGTSSAEVTQEILQGNAYTFDNSTDTTGIEITFNNLNGSLYTFATVTRYNYAPLNPTFNTTAPILSSNYFKIKGQGINSYTGDVVLKLNYYPAVLNPKQIIVYARPDSNSNFIALPTSYDSTNNELDFTTSTLGDFAFGIPQTIDSSYAPFPFSPGNADTVTTYSVEFKWGIRGIVSSFHLQVATDSSFNDIVIDTTGFRSTIFTDTSLSRGTFYFWRVNNTNITGTSSWSNTASFYLSTTITGLYTSNNTVANKFKLSQNYPNPFNPSTLIRYSLPNDSQVRVDIFNIIGQRVATLVNSFKRKGDYEISWNASNYSSGVYFYTINAANNSGKQFFDVKKMILLK
jgi:hypothetical protein